MTATGKKCVAKGAPFYFVTRGEEGGKKNLEQFFNSYHFVVYIYICDFSFPKYSTVSTKN